MSALRGAGDDAFQSAVASAFGFLIDRYGFTRGPLQVVAYERWIEFENPAAKVTVTQEMGSAPFVTLAAPRPIASGLRREFGLHELEQEMEKLGRYQRTPSSPDDLEESLALQAGILARLGAEILNGDFTILFERLRRHVDAVSDGRSSEHL